MNSPELLIFGDLNQGALSLKSICEKWQVWEHIQNDYTWEQKRLDQTI